MVAPSILQTPMNLDRGCPSREDLSESQYQGCNKCNRPFDVSFFRWYSLREDGFICLSIILVKRVGCKQTLGSTPSNWQNMCHYIIHNCQCCLEGKTRHSLDKCLCSHSYTIKYTYIQKFKMSRHKHKIYTYSSCWASRAHLYLWE